MLRKNNNIEWEKTGTSLTRMWVSYNGSILVFQTKGVSSILTIHLGSDQQKSWLIHLPDTQKIAGMGLFLSITGR